MPTNCQLRTDEGLPCTKTATGIFDCRGDEYQACTEHGEEAVRMGGAAEFVLFTCDCGEPLDPTVPVSMCRACFDACEPTTTDL